MVAEHDEIARRLATKPFLGPVMDMQAREPAVGVADLASVAGPAEGGAGAGAPLRRVDVETVEVSHGYRRIHGQPAWAWAGSGSSGRRRGLGLCGRIRKAIL